MTYNKEQQLIKEIENLIDATTAAVKRNDWKYAAQLMAHVMKIKDEMRAELAPVSDHIDDVAADISRMAHEWTRLYGLRSQTDR